MITDRVTATLTVAGTTVPVDLDQGATITLDQGWAPFATAEVTIPASDALAYATDPRVMVRATLTVQQAWSESAYTLDDLTALPEFAGTLDALGTAWAGLTLDEVGDLYGDRWGNPTWRAPETRTFDLGLRRRGRDYVADTITLTLMSDERLAQESCVGVPETIAAETLSARVAWLLSYLGTDVPVTVDLGTAATLTAPAITVDWDTTVWDALSESVTALALRPWCDEHRVWRVTPTSGAITTIVHLPRVITADDTTDRDGDWADWCVFIDNYTSGGVPSGSITYLPDFYTDHRKVKVTVRQLGELGSPPVVPATPDYWSVTDLAAGRGRLLTLTAPLDLAVRPGMGLTTGLPSLPALSGQVERVHLDLAAAEMTITTRDTITGG